MIFIPLIAYNNVLARPWGADFRYLYISLAERIKSGDVISVIA